MNARAKFAGVMTLIHLKPSIGPQLEDLQTGFRGRDIRVIWQDCHGTGKRDVVESCP